MWLHSGKLLRASYRIIENDGERLTARRQRMLHRTVTEATLACTLLFRGSYSPHVGAAHMCIAAWQ
jgi:hypothetical protein